MLKKRNRLLKTADFQAAYQQGKYVVAKQMVIYRLPKPDNTNIRIGFVVSKKVGQAHVRNRCKRLLRAAMNQFLPELAPEYDLVVVARPPLAKDNYQDVYKTMAKLLRKAKLLGDVSR